MIITVLLGAAGLLTLLTGLTMVAVYCAFVIAHRTDEIVARMGEDAALGGNRLLHHV